MLLRQVTGTSRRHCAPLLVACSLLLGGCDAPGKGARAELGYAQGAKIIAAISAYRKDAGDLPGSLEVLVPRYLDKADLTFAPASNSRYPFVYAVKAGGSYELEFSYVPPGMNTCVYRSDTAAWTCSGHY